MTHAPTVKVAELDPNCEGCMAAQRAMSAMNYGKAKAMKKIREQAREISNLKEQIDMLRSDRDVVE